MLNSHGTDMKRMRKMKRQLQLNTSAFLRLWNKDDCFMGFEFPSVKNGYSAGPNFTDQKESQWKYAPEVKGANCLLIFPCTHLLFNLLVTSSSYSHLSQSGTYSPLLPAQPPLRSQSWSQWEIKRTVFYSINICVTVIDHVRIACIYRWAKIDIYKIGLAYFKYFFRLNKEFSLLIFYVGTNKQRISILVHTGFAGLPPGEFRSVCIKPSVSVNGGRWWIFIKDVFPPKKIHKKHIQVHW